MTSKSLSTSTLSLKFMQNAQRAKQLKGVELDRAEVKDDGKWEVSQAVRESWGMSKDTQKDSGDVHEASYLPFLFSEDATGKTEPDQVDVITKKPIGRRAFNKRGEEVTLGTTPVDPTRVSAPQSTSSAPATGRKIHTRPVSISASGTSGQLQGLDQLKKDRESKNSKTAREAIFESGGVGIDIRSQARNNDTPPTSSTFLKPVGVDEPKDIQTASTTAGRFNSEKIIHGARQKGKVKREREEAKEVNEINKPKKKKRNPS